MIVLYNLHSFICTSLLQLTLFNSMYLVHVHQHLISDQQVLTSFSCLWYILDSSRAAFSLC